MKVIFTTCVLALTASALLVTPGCASHPQHHHEAYVEPTRTQEVIVVEEPPAAHVEAVPGAPTPSHVWVPGYWTRRGNSWVWIEGAHVVRPHPGLVWVPGQWVHRPGGYVRVPGHWE